MPGKAHSPHPYQQKPYVIQMQNGKAFDKIGNMVFDDVLKLIYQWKNLYIELNSY